YTLGPRHRRLHYAVPTGSPDVSSRPPPTPPGVLLPSRRRNALRRTLIGLALTLLVLLAWQLAEDYRQRLDPQKRFALAHGEQLTKHLGLSMQLKAQASMALLLNAAPEQPDGVAQAELMAALRNIFPTFASLVWMDARGQIIADSSSVTHDLGLLRTLQQRSYPAPYHFSFSAQDDGTIYLLLRLQDTRISVLRLSAQALNGW